MILTLDFETRSACSLPDTNPWVYAEHPTTQIICCSAQQDARDPLLWVAPWAHEIIRDHDHQLPLISLQRFLALVEGADLLEAHNAEFEQAIWTIMAARYGAPPQPIHRWSCTAARASRMALPRSLGKLSQEAGTSQHKDSGGRELMLKMCKPRHPRKDEREVNPRWEETLYWWETPQQVVDLCRYCLQDARAEYALNEALQPLPPFEVALWRLDQEINQRGVYCDTELVLALDREINGQKEEMTQELIDLTGGLVSTAQQHARLTSWLCTRGVQTKSVSADAVAKLLAGDLPEDVRRVLEIRRQLGPSSVSKLLAMMRSVSSDSRLRGQYMYHGASTGRWSGKGVQLQNLPRGTFKRIPEAADAALKTGVRAAAEAWEQDITPFTSALVRPCLRAAPDKKLVCGDFSSIEGRVLAWMAGEEAVLELYRDGEDVYKHTAGAIYGRRASAVTKDQRQVGKVAELALGYQGWVGAFQSMAVNYGVQVSDDRAAEIANAWRKNRPLTVKLWSKSLQAVTDAIANPGKVYREGRCSFATDENWLFLRLPSGRLLFYRRPHLREVEHYGRKKIVPHYWGTDSYTKQWTPLKLHGGKIVENMVQACARCFQAEAMLRVGGRYPIVMHTHDEVVSEVLPYVQLQPFLDCLAEAPTWAVGCPVDVTGWEGVRYRKD